MQTATDPARRSGILGILETVAQPIENVSAVVGGVMMILAMVLMTGDALGRYVFNSPIMFAPRLIEHYLMVGMFTMPLAWGFRTGGYIRIIAAVNLLPPAFRNLILRMGLLAGSFYVAALAWMSGGKFLEIWRDNEIYVGVIDWPVAWSWIWVPAGLWLFALRLVLMTVGPAANLAVTHSEGA